MEYSYHFISENLLKTNWSKEKKGKTLSRIIRILQILLHTERKNAIIMCKSMILVTFNWTKIGPLSPSDLNKSILIYDSFIQLNFFFSVVDKCHIQLCGTICKSKSFGLRVIMEIYSLWIRCICLYSSKTFSPKLNLTNQMVTMIQLERQKEEFRNPFGKSRCVMSKNQHWTHLHSFFLVRFRLISCSLSQFSIWVRSRMPH